jgi:hypothetical protein
MPWGHRLARPYISLQETLHFVRGKIPGKRTESLANWMFVREFPRGISHRKTAHRKPFARGSTPGKKTRALTPGKLPGIFPDISPGIFPHFILQPLTLTDWWKVKCQYEKNQGHARGLTPGKRPFYFFFKNCFIYKNVFFIN